MLPPLRATGAACCARVGLSCLPPSGWRADQLRGRCQLDLELKIRQKSGITVVGAAGEIDVFTAPDLDAGLGEVIAAGGVRIVLDLTGVTFLDSTGLGVLVKSLKSVRAEQGWVRLVIGSQKIRKIFDITGLDAAMPLYDTVEEAMAG